MPACPGYARSEMASPFAWSSLGTTSRDHRNRAADVVIALAVFGLSLAIAGGRAADSADTRSLDLLGVVLLALASLPLVARRRSPLAVFVVTAVASAAANLVGYPPGPPLGPTVALYFLALTPERTRASRWVVVAVVGGLLVLHAGGVALAADEPPAVPLLFGVLVWGGAWVIGDRIRMRRERISDLEERARRAERDAERERRLAAAEERTRIARDLHDSAGHAINVILVQAGAARLLGTRDPERAQAALATIEEVARETLGEIDQLVRVLRDDEPREDGANGNVEPPLGLAALGTLADRHRSAGLDVTVRWRGERRALTPALDRAAYRIVQEALTNAARHGAGSADVDLTSGPAGLRLVVSNPIRRDEPIGQAGHGIVGMRERAALLGGTLTTAVDGDLFRIEANLPYAGDGA
jgi:signal transduction histidine kinase